MLQRETVSLQCHMPSVAARVIICGTPHQHMQLILGLVTRRRGEVEKREDGHGRIAIPSYQLIHQSNSEQHRMVALSHKYPIQTSPNQHHYYNHHLHAFLCYKYIPDLVSHFDSRTQYIVRVCTSSSSSGIKLMYLGLI